MPSYQIKEESVQASAKTHRGEDAQTDPVGTPQRLLLHVAHILQRTERGTVNHMAETHAQSVKKTRKGEGEGGGVHSASKEGTEWEEVRVCETEGPLKAGRKKEGEEGEWGRNLRLLSLKDRAVG